MTKLQELVHAIDSLDENAVIVVRGEWTCDSDAKVVPLESDGRVPEDARTAGYGYFLEIDVARQVLEEFASNPAAGAAEKCRRLIEYAKNDA